MDLVSVGVLVRREDGGGMIRCVYCGGWAEEGHVIVWRCSSCRSRASDMLNESAPSENWQRWRMYETPVDGHRRGLSSAACPEGALFVPRGREVPG